VQFDHAEVFLWVGLRLIYAFEGGAAIVILHIRQAVAIASGKTCLRVMQRRTDIELFGRPKGIADEAARQR